MSSRKKKKSQEDRRKGASVSDKKPSTHKSKKKNKLRALVARRREEFEHRNYAPDYINKYSCNSGDRFVIFARESTPQQESNIEGQTQELKDKVNFCSGIVVEIIQHIGNGSDCIGLKKAIMTAKKLKAILLVESVGRLVRNRSYHPVHYPHLLPEKGQFDEIRSIAPNVQIMSGLDPSAAPQEIRSNETKRGQKAKGNKGGRPKKNKPGYKKKIREEKLGAAIKCREEGYSLSAISRKLEVKKSTIQYWMDHFVNAVRFLIVFLICKLSLTL